MKNFNRFCLASLTSMSADDKIRDSPNITIYMWD